jgi:hypothetical protein
MTAVCVVTAVCAAAATKQPWHVAADATVQERVKAMALYLSLSTQTPNDALKEHAAIVSANSFNGSRNASVSCDIIERATTQARLHTVERSPCSV